MLVWVACAAVAGDIGAAWPLAVAVAAEFLNEGLDRLRTGSWRWPDTIQDVVNSVLWPAVLFALARAGVI